MTQNMDDVTYAQHALVLRELAGGHRGIGTSALAAEDVQIQIGEGAERVADLAAQVDDLEHQLGQLQDEKDEAESACEEHESSAKVWEAWYASLLGKSDDDVIAEIRQRRDGALSPTVSPTLPASAGGT